MRPELEELLSAGQDLIGQIEDAKESLESDIESLNDAANGIDTAVKDLTKQAEDLQHQIDAARTLPNYFSDPVALATMEAIDNLIKLLTEAKKYFTDGESLAAYGTLVMFDEHADNLTAAVRLCKMAQRRAK